MAGNPRAAPASRSSSPQIARILPDSSAGFRPLSCLERGQEEGASQAPMTIATLVVPEPPMFRVAIFLAPSIW